jgi:hypothetical protein
VRALSTGCCRSPLSQTWRMSRASRNGVLGPSSRSISSASDPRSSEGSTKRASESAKRSAAAAAFRRWNASAIRGSASRSNRETSVCRGRS